MERRGRGEQIPHAPANKIQTKKRLYFIVFRYPQSGDTPQRPATLTPNPLKGAKEGKTNAGRGIIFFRTPEGCYICSPGFPTRGFLE